MRRSPESQKNLRAKTVRIGKIRWPPPLNSEDADNANQQRLLPRHSSRSLFESQCLICPFFLSFENLDECSFNVEFKKKFMEIKS